MDQEKNPVDILNEILNRPEAPPPSPAPGPTRFDPPPPGDDPLPPPETDRTAADAGASAKLLPWLCLVLGAALLVMGVCLLQVTGINRRLDALQSDLKKESRTVDELWEENQRLQRENDDLQEQVDHAAEELKQTYDSLTAANKSETRKSYRMRQSEYLYYMERFVEQGDLSMAALVMTLEDDVLRPPEDDEPERFLNGGPLSSVQQERYDEVRRVLEKKGVLYSSGMTKKNDTAPLWPDGTGPSENYDTAALGILWCALDAYFVKGNSQAAAQYLCFDLQESLMGYQERMEGLAGEFALRLYQVMRDELVEAQWLTVTKADGRVGLGSGPTGYAPDVLYSLPFDLPAPGSWDSALH